MEQHACDVDQASVSAACQLNFMGGVLSMPDSSRKRARSPSPYDLPGSRRASLGEYATDPDEELGNLSNKRYLSQMIACEMTKQMNLCQNSGGGSGAGGLNSSMPFGDPFPHRTLSSTAADLLEITMTTPSDSTGHTSQGECNGQDSDPFDEVSGGPSAASAGLLGSSGMPNNKPPIGPAVLRSTSPGLSEWSGLVPPGMLLPIPALLQRRISDSGMRAGSNPIPLRQLNRSQFSNSVSGPSADLPASPNDISRGCSDLRKAALLRSLRIRTEDGVPPHEGSAQMQQHPQHTHPQQHLQQQPPPQHQHHHISNQQQQPNQPQQQQQLLPPQLREQQPLTSSFTAGASASPATHHLGGVFFPDDRSQPIGASLEVAPGAGALQLPQPLAGYSCQPPPPFSSMTPSARVFANFPRLGANPGVQLPAVGPGGPSVPSVPPVPPAYQQSLLSQARYLSQGGSSCMSLSESLQTSTSMDTASGSTSGGEETPPMTARSSAGGGVASGFTFGLSLSSPRPDSSSTGTSEGQQPVLLGSTPPLVLTPPLPLPGTPLSALRPLAAGQLQQSPVGGLALTGPFGSVSPAATVAAGVAAEAPSTPHS